MPKVTPDVLKKMQEESKKRYAFFVETNDVQIDRPKVPDANDSAKEKQINRLARMINKLAVFYDPQTAGEKRKPVVAKIPRVIIPKKVRVRMDEPRAFIPTKDDKPFTRPPAKYDNHKKSLYGIDYDDL